MGEVVRGAGGTLVLVLCAAALAGPAQATVTDPSATVPPTASAAAGPAPASPAAASPRSSAIPTSDRGDVFRGVAVTKVTQARASVRVGVHWDSGLIRKSGKHSYVVRVLALPSASADNRALTVTTPTVVGHKITSRPKPTVKITVPSSKRGAFTTAGSVIVSVTQLQGPRTGATSKSSPRYNRAYTASNAPTSASGHACGSRLIKPGSSVAGCRLIGTYLANFNLNRVNASRTDLTSAVLNHSSVRRTKFADAIFTGLQATNIIGRPASLPTGWELSGNELTPTPTPTPTPGPTPTPTPTPTPSEVAQTVTFGTAPSVVVNGTGTASAAVTSPSTGGGTITYSSDTPSACSIDPSTGLVTGVTAGTDNCTIKATAAAVTGWLTGQATQTFSIATIAQTVTFDSAPAVTVGTTGTVTAHTNGDGVLSYSTTSTDCSVNPSTGVVTGAHAGTDNCEITATAAGTTDWASGTNTLTLSIGQGSAQTVTFDTAPAVTVGSTGTVTAHTNGNGDLTYSTTSTDCSVDPSTGVVTGAHTGTDNCTITADAAATTDWAAGTNTLTFSIGQGAAQSVTFDTAPTVTVGSTGTVTAHTNGDGALSYSTTSTDCSVDPSTGVVTGNHAGTNNCEITADAAATTDWAPGTNTLTFSIGQGSAQSVTFDTAPTVTVGTTGTVTAHTNGDGALSYSTASTDCSVNPSTGVVTGAHAGTDNCTITADAAGTTDWAAGSAQQTLSIGQGAAQTVTFDTAPTVTVGSTGTVTAHTNGDGALSYSTASTDCSVDSSTGVVTGNHAGTDNCEITANAAATTDWAAGTNTLTFSIGQGAAQSVTFDTAPTVTVGTTGTVTAHTNGNGDLTYSTTSTDCSVDPSTGVVTGIHAGTDNCVITATASATTDWATGTNNLTFNIGAVAQTVTFGTAPSVVVNGTGTASATVTSPSTGGGAITYSSETTSECTVDSNTGLVTGVTAGTDNCTIKATAAAVTGWLAGEASQTFSIATSGNLDTAFNTGTGPNNVIFDLAAQADGKSIIVGNFVTYNGSTANRIARLNSDGSLDGTFNSGTGFNNLVNIVAIQPDGRIIVSGTFTTYNGSAAVKLVRLNSDGSLDNTFSTGTGFDNTITAIVVQPDGGILVAGAFTSYDGTARKRIARLTSSGALDTNFGTTSTGLSDQVNDIAVQSDGDILAVGNFLFYQTGASTSVTARYVARLNSDGTLDSSFALTGSGFDGTISTLAVQSDGKIIIGGGKFKKYNGTTLGGIARLNSDGTLDSSFSSGSGFNTNTIDTMVVQPDGKILVGGQTFTTYNGSTAVRIARLNSDGTLDSSFQSGTGFDNTVYAIAPQSNGTIMVAGNFTTYNDSPATRVVRLYG